MNNNNSCLRVLVAAKFDFFRRKPDKELPGDNTGGATPVPIPNTEAKPVGPMVVRKGESRSSPGL